MNVKTTETHFRMHWEFCPSAGACEHIGGEGDRSECRAFDERLRQAEEEHTQAAAQKLLDMHAETLLRHGQHVAQGLLLAYRTVAPDPYYREDS